MHIGGAPGEPLREAWIHLTAAEAVDLLEALKDYFDGPTDPDWHTHATDGDREVTIAVGAPDSA